MLDVWWLFSCYRLFILLCQSYLLVNKVDDKCFIVTQCVLWWSLFVYQELREWQRIIDSYDQRTSIPWSASALTIRAYITFIIALQVFTWWRCTNRHLLAALTGCVVFECFERWTRQQGCGDNVLEVQATARILTQTNPVHYIQWKENEIRGG